MRRRSHRAHLQAKSEGRLAPAPAIYTEFELDTDGRTLLLKEGRIRVTDVKKPEPVFGFVNS